MSKGTKKGRTTPRKQAARPTGDNADLLDLFAEAEAKAQERNGLEIILAGKRFELWSAQMSYRQRQQCWQHTGLTPTDAAAMLHGGSGSIEAIAAVIAMSMFQMYEVFPDMDGVVSWVEQSLFDFEDGDEIPMDVRVLQFEEDEESGPEA